MLIRRPVMRCKTSDISLRSVSSRIPLLRARLAEKPLNTCQVFFSGLFTNQWQKGDALSFPSAPYVSHETPSSLPRRVVLCKSVRRSGSGRHSDHADRFGDAWRFILGHRCFRHWFSSSRNFPQRKRQVGVSSRNGN